MFNTTFWIDRFLQYMKDKFYLDFMQTNEKALGKIALNGLLYVIPVLSVVTGVVSAVRFDWGWGSVAAGFAMVPLCVFLRYIAEKMLPYIDALISKSPSQIASQSILDIFACVFGIAGIVILVTALFSEGIISDMSDLFLFGLFFLFCEYMMAMLLTPEDSLNVVVNADTSPAQELIGITSTVVKAFYRLVPIVFGASIVFAVIILGDVLSSTTLDGNESFRFAACLSSAFLPLLGYLIFLIYYFVLDLCGAFLKIPGKLDALINKK